MCTHTRSVLLLVLVLVGGVTFKSKFRVIELQTRQLFI